MPDDPEAQLARLNDLVRAENARHAEQVHQETRRHLIQLAEYTADAARLESEIEALRKTRRLRPHHEPRTMSGAMNTPTLPDSLLPKPPRARKPAAPRAAPRAPQPWIGKVTTNPHPFPQALLAAKPPKKILDWARENLCSRESVNGWCAPVFLANGKKNPASRRIPLSAAKAIAKQYPSVPATLETWPQGFLPERPEKP